MKIDGLRAIKVVVSDPDSGEILEEKVVRDDYMLLCVGNRYVKSFQIMGQTHMLAIAVAKETK